MVGGPRLVEQSVRNRPPSGGAEINLSERFPVSWRYVIRKSWFWIMAFGLTGLGYIVLIALEQVEDPRGRGAEVLTVLLLEKKSILLVGLGLVLFFRLGYSILYRMTLRYSIANNRLRVRRGVVLREEASLPLLPLTELFLKPSLPDLILGLRNLYISTPLERVARFANIEGLRTEDARRLKSFIERSITQISDSKDASLPLGDSGKGGPGNEFDKVNPAYLPNAESS